MIAAYLKNHQYIRIGFAFVLLLLLGYKTVAPVVLIAKAALKEISATESDDNKLEKKGETESSSEKNNEYACFCGNSEYQFRDFTIIAHTTSYFDHYQPSHYFEITTPPPDFILNTTI